MKYLQLFLFERETEIEECDEPGTGDVAAGTECCFLGSEYGALWERVRQNKYGILWTNDRHIGKEGLLIVQSGCNSFQGHSVYHFACPNITTTVSTIKEVDPCMSNVRTNCYY